MINCDFSLFFCYSWLDIRMASTAGTLVFLTALFCVLSSRIPYLDKHINASLVGLAISLSFDVSLNVTARFVRLLILPCLCFYPISEIAYTSWLLAVHRYKIETVLAQEFIIDFETYISLNSR